MRTGRPVTDTSGRKVGIHENGGHRYASTQVKVVDENGKTSYRRVHWGTVDENMKFHPGTKYIYADPQERKSLVFPEGWDLSETCRINGEDKRGVKAYEGDDVDRQYGTTWFLDRVAEKTGLTYDLKKVFGGNIEIVNDILTMAYYPFLDHLSYAHLEKWQDEVKAPSDRKLTSTVITRLTQSITERNRMDLFKLRAARLGKDELCAVDSTSISTYGINLVDIRWGRNKEHLPLRQTVEVVVYSITSHQPIYYRELPGNMPDSRTIEMILTELEHAGFRNLVLITDRGYESMKNLETYIGKGQKVITSVKVTQGDVLKIIKGLDMSLGYPKGMKICRDNKLFYAQYDMEYTVDGNGDHKIPSDRYKINLYYSTEVKAAAVNLIQLEVQEQSEAVAELISTGYVMKDADDIRKKYNLLVLEADSNGKIKSFREDTDKIEGRLRTAGFFASKTLGVDLTPLEAMDTYGMRDEQEKCFALQKGLMFQDRLRVWSEASKHGRMFICFIGLILASYIRNVVKDNKELKEAYPSTESLMAEFRTIRCIEHNGRRKFITPFVGAQVDICKAFGFTIPDHCAPEYVSKKTPSKGRGRKPKPKTETQTY